jgi:hypothetical protein
MNFRVEFRLRLEILTETVLIDARFGGYVVPPVPCRKIVFTDLRNKTKACTLNSFRRSVERTAPPVTRAAPWWSGVFAP